MTEIEKCPVCNLPCDKTIRCDNNCGTKICPNGHSFYVMIKDCQVRIVKGHNPTCGDDC
jgi:hypothetical protein